MCGNRNRSSCPALLSALPITILTMVALFFHVRPSKFRKFRVRATFNPVGQQENERNERKETRHAEFDAETVFGYACGAASGGRAAETYATRFAADAANPFTKSVILVLF
jgi:hypothetical protein